MGTTRMLPVTFVFSLRISLWRQDHGVKVLSHYHTRMSVDIFFVFIRNESYLNRNRPCL